MFNKNGFPTGSNLHFNVEQISPKWVIFILLKAMEKLLYLKNIFAKFHFFFSQII